MIYANGLRVDINEIVRLTFMECKDQTTLKVVAEIAIQFECLKNIRDSLNNVIEQHEVALGISRR